MKYYITTILILMFSMTLKAQETDLSNETITWNCSGIMDNTNGNNVNQPSEIISGTNSLIWRQGGNDQEFQVTDRFWNWNSGEGSITYSVSFGGATGTVEIQSNIIDINLNSTSGDISFSLDVIDFTY